MGKIHRVIATDKAKELIAQLKASHGELMFHQSGGCCDGSQPMCYEKGDFRTGSSDVRLDMVEGCEFWMAKDQFQFWQYSELTLDVIAGRGSSFSIEIPLGFRFLTRSRIFTDDEVGDLVEVVGGE
ncbi:DUF779 domain-containing protein [Flavipsychrobacter stenotrophus]|uniref:DUF779 domain-containing protein n=1 Tax=Flavipsychrobacter stenotrophus TaxID=2077091 RepID=A0A2S7T2I8_9BACT|nr:DUF779 domain-containing protein [Flavipsychrobacter stenotrophus]PQJ12976.1 DUF779 domain-containing protein [Flavipsychrobacter stenotrophus]